MIEGVHFVRKRLADRSFRWFIYTWRGGNQVMWADGEKKPNLTAAALEKIAAEQRLREAAQQPDLKSSCP